MFDNNTYSNILISYLKILNIRFTHAYARKLYEECPDRDNLYGISKMLSAYHIENETIQIQHYTENTLFELLPFITKFNNELIIIHEINDNNIKYINKKGERTVKPEEFIEQWTRIALVSEAKEESTEPDYSGHRKADLMKNIRIGMALCVSIVLFCTLYFKEHLYNSPGLSLIILLNLSGIYTCYLLLLKQLNIHNSNADKICTSIPNGNCNTVLNSAGAKVMGLFSWGEIGFGYFISNPVVILVLPRFTDYMLLINMLALPYSVWSVLYQKLVIKQWCPLCLIVQLIFWSVFAVILSFRLINFPSFRLEDILFVAFIYLIPLFTVNTIVSILSEKRRLEYLPFTLSRLKTEKGVFAHLLKQQQHYDVDKQTSKILFGNRDSEFLLTVLTNPNCKGCAFMYERINHLLKKHGDRICIQYIFKSFGSSFDNMNQNLIGIYLNSAPYEAWKIFGEWFEIYKDKAPEFIEKYCGENKRSNDIINEFDNHNAWLKSTDLKVTPMLLINGYVLPDYYTVEDMDTILENDVIT